MRNRLTPSEGQKAYRAKVGQWLEAIEKRFGVSRAEVAKRAGVSHTTLYRWFDEGLNHIPSQSAILRIATAMNVPGPDGLPLIAGFAEAGAAPLAPAQDDPPLSPNQSWWRAGDRALELHGIMPGDRLLLDQAAEARSGDVVVANIEDPDLGAALTVIRLLDGDFLVTRTWDRELASAKDYVNGRSVRVMGPIVRLVRERP